MSKHKDTISSYNIRVGKRLRFFRELRKLNQTDLAIPLGYKSSGAWSLIESGERGLNKAKITQAARILGTFPEILTTDTDLTDEELIDMHIFLTVRTNKKHPAHKMLMEVLKNTKSLQ